MILSNLEKIRVLILSDDKEIGFIYRSILKNKFKNINLEKIEDIQINDVYIFDLILIDIEKLKSIEFLKKLDPHKAFSSKIILITPFNSSEINETLKSMNFINVLLTKPVAPNKIIEAVKSLNADITNHYLLKEKNDVLMDFFVKIPNRVGIFDLDGKLFFCNALYLEDHDIFYEDMDEITFDNLSKCGHKFEQLKARILFDEDMFTVDRKEEKSDKWFRSTFFKIQNKFIVHQCADITKDILAQEKLKQSSIFFENANEGIIITDEHGHILSANKAFSKITGYHIKEVQGKKPSILQSGLHKEDFYNNMWDSLKHNSSWQGEIWNKRKNGEIYPEWLSISKIEDKETITKNFYIAIFTDITNLKEADKKVYFYANHDHLTGLANRLNIESRFAHSLSIAKRKKKKVGLLFIDIDNFKDINDTYSHEVGDEVIKAVATILESNIRDEDTLGRIGGDEFLIVLGDIEEDGDIINFVKKIQYSFQDPINIKNNIFYITLSIGIAIYPDHGTNTDVLKQCGDLAMYQAKINGKNSYSMYNESLSSDLKMKVDTINDLRNALSNNELEVYYQPVIDFKTGYINSAEALVRWNHPTKGLIAPMDFILIAEEKGLISELTADVFNKVLIDLEKINKIYPHSPKFKIAVNISAKDFFSKTFSQKLLKYFDGYDIGFEQIELEITETQIMKNYEVAIKIINDLKEKGFRFAIDDFGTGYSSLSYLKYFNIDKLKIDQSFIFDAPNSKDDAQIAKTIVVMAKTFDMKVQAEGVEEKIHEDFVKQIDCDFGQGYFYSKPIRFKELCDGFIKQ